MLDTRGSTAMAKRPAPPPEPTEEDRVTVLNVKGSVAEREGIRAISRASGVPISEIARRGIAMWAKKRGLKGLPDDWTAE